MEQVCKLSLSNKMSEVLVSFYSFQSSHNSAGKTLPDGLILSMLAFPISQSVMVSDMWLSTSHNIYVISECRIGSCVHAHLYKIKRFLTSTISMPLPKYHPSQSSIFYITKAHQRSFFGDFFLLLALAKENGMATSLLAILFPTG